MQRKRLLAQGLLSGDPKGAATAAAALASMVTVPVPSTLIPEDLLRAAASGKLRLLKALVSPDAPVEPRSKDTTGEEASSSATPIDHRAALLVSVLSLPLLSASQLPVSCMLHASALTSHVLPARVIAARIGFDGATRVVSLQAHSNVDASLRKVTSAVGPMEIRQPATPPMLLPNLMSSLNLRLSVDLPQLCVSLVGGDIPEEFLLVSLDGVSFSVERQRPYTSCDLRIQELQVDNQLPDAAHAVVITRAPPKHDTVIQSEDGSEVLIRPVLQVSLVHQSHRVTAAPLASSRDDSAARGSSSVLHIPYASLLLQEMDFVLEESLVKRLVSFISSYSGGPLQSDSTDSLADEPLQVLAGTRIAGMRQHRGSIEGVLGVNLAEKRGRLRRGLAAARDRVAASILSRMAASNKRRRASLDSSDATRFQQQLADLRLRAQVSAAKDFRRVMRAQKAALRAVKRGVGTFGSLITASAERARDEIQATLRQREARQRPADTQSAVAAVGISGPALARPAPAAALHRESAAVHAASSRRVAALQQQRQAAASLLQFHSRNVGAADSDTALWASAAADSVTALSADAQWWWPGRMPPGDLEPREAAVQLFIEHLLLNPLALNVSFTRNATSADNLRVDELDGSSLALRRSGDGSGPLAIAFRALGVMALSLNRAPVRMNGLELVNVLAGSEQLSTRIAQHYISAGLAEVYKVCARVSGGIHGVLKALEHSESACVRVSGRPLRRCAG